MTELSINDFLSRLSSGAPVPGGGAAAALAGAIGAGLGGMVCSLTAGKKKYAAYETDIKRLAASMEELRSGLAGLMQKDAEAFEPLAGLYKVKSCSSPEEERALEIRKEQALAGACAVPLEVLRLSCRCLEGLEELERKGSVLACSDVGAGASLAAAAAQASFLNVLINTKAMKDRETALRMQGEGEALLKSANDTAGRIYARVTDRLAPGN